MRRRLHLARQAAADALLVLWGLLWWNARKTRFRLRGGRCPCQSPGDSGRGGETRCDAAQMLHSPGRFRLACPLLARTDHGWVCSVGAAQVRPFWGRAAGMLAALGLAGWIGLAAAAWGATLALGWRGAGPLDFAWPGRWNRLPLAQAETFRHQAMSAFAHDDYPAALLALSTAYTRSPRLDDGLLLAALRERSGAYVAGDRLFEDLLARFPAERARVVWALHDCLLVTGRADALAALALDELARVTAPGAEWTRALVFAAGRLATPAGWESRLAAAPGLSAATRDLAGAVLLRREGREAEAAARLGACAPDNPAEAAALVGLWLEWGRPAEAAAAFQRHRLRLDPFEELLLAYAINHAGGRAEASTGYRTRVLLHPLTPARLDALGARLVAAPDPVAAAALCRKALEDPASPPTMLAVAWLLAVRHGDTAAAAALVPRVARVTGFAPPPVPSRWEDAAGQLTLTLPLPRQTVRALVALAPAPAPVAR